MTHAVYAKCCCGNDCPADDSVTVALDTEGRPLVLPSALQCGAAKGVPSEFVLHLMPG